MAVTVERKLEVARRSYQILAEEMGIPPEDIWWDAARLPLRHRRRRPTSARRRRRSRACARVKELFPRHQDDPRRLERQLRPARRRPRGAQLGLPLPLHQGRAGRRHRQHREAGALRRHPGGGARAGRGADLPADRRRRGGQQGGRGVHRATSAAASLRGRRAKPRAELPLDERLSRAVVEGTKEGLEDGSRRGPARSALAGAARHHQRPADGRHGRGRPPVQRQPAHRGRGAAERRGDEGGGLLPRAAHGEGRRRRRAARSCSRRSRATSTTSARTWWTSSSRTTASRW